MRNLEQHITQYAAYHRDRRNIATHCIGIPMIAFSVALALSVVPVPLVYARPSMALVATALVAIYYCALDLKIGAAMLAYLAANYLLAAELSARLSMADTLGLALAIFLLGWLLQFLGHRYEGMKPAFFDDIMGLAIGPLFVMAELFFMLGLKRELRRYVEARVGPTVAARNGAPVRPLQS